MKCNILSLHVSYRFSKQQGERGLRFRCMCRDVCALIPDQIRAEQQNTEDGGHGYLLRVVEAIGVCEGVVSCVQSGRCCESATFKTEDEKIESFIQQYIWDKCLKIKYWALL